jgi:hypothetical protein
VSWKTPSLETRAAQDSGEEGFSFLRREILDDLLAVGRARLPAPEELLDGELEALVRGGLGLRGRHLVDQCTAHPGRPGVPKMRRATVSAASACMVGVTC